MGHPRRSVAVISSDSVFTTLYITKYEVLTQELLQRTYLDLGT